MYKIEPESIKAFLDDRTIRFPRFQRKQTWNGEQNFKLAISVFKNFPLGVTIINKVTYNSKSTRWLLDGRQRRNALAHMHSNPENLYDWSKKFVGIKPGDQPSDITNKFWAAVDSYLNDGDEEGFNEARNEAIERGDPEFQFEGKTYTIDSQQEEVIEDASHEFEEEDLPEPASDGTSDLVAEYQHDLRGDLENLLFVIKTVHKKTQKKSGFTQPFDFRKQLPNLNLPYVDIEQRSLSGRKLKTFIDEYLNFALEPQDDGVGNTQPSPSSLFDFFESRFDKDVKKNKQKLRNAIKQNWDDIEASIRAVVLIREQLQSARIGVIETSSITSTDAQMIFTLINKEGTKLSAVEILSAKPSWNLPVKNPSSDVVEQRQLLYAGIGTSVEKTVRWDYPATFYERLNIDFLFPKYSYTKKSELDKKLTLGFKILSGLYQKGIKKEDVDSLSSNREIDWEKDIDVLLSELNQMANVLRSHDYFLRLPSLGKTLMEITSDACALNFLFLTYLDYQRKGKPAGSNKDTIKFTKNALKLADQMVFEYVTFKWRGSSDSKVAKNLLTANALPEDYKAVSEQRWKSLVKGINDSQTIDDTEITFGLCKSIVFHTYAVRKRSIQAESLYDIDHIIPQAVCDASDSITSDRIKHSLFNLCPLPARENKKKGKKTLASLTEDWLIDHVKYFAEIDQKDFATFSKASNWEKLRTKRRGQYETKFLKDRKAMFDNE